MKICYVDESGDTGALPSATSPVQPVLVIAGMIVDHRDVPALTEEFIELKRRMFRPARTRVYLDSILTEIKGSDVRKEACAASRNTRRHAFRLLDGVLDMLERFHIKILGRSWIKWIGQPVNGRALYTYSTQSMFATFQNYLEIENDIGVLTADNRTHALNRNVSHSIFTQKFKRDGDVFDRIVDLPTFAVSDNHAGLQLCDLLCSAIIFPMSVHAYCTGHVTNLHVRPGYQQICQHYAARVKALQHRFRDQTGRRRGGITVSDGLAQRTGAVLFR